MQTILTGSMSCCWYVGIYTHPNIVFLQFWNRDSSAARQILRLTVTQLLQLPRPASLCKQAGKCSPPKSARGGVELSPTYGRRISDLCTSVVMSTRLPPEVNCQWESLSNIQKHT